MGWPGSIHDNQVWAKSDVYLSKEKYFGNKEFLMCDSAFSMSSVMVPAIKKSPNANLSERGHISTQSWLKYRLRVNIA